MELLLLVITALLFTSKLSVIHKSPSVCYCEIFSTDVYRDFIALSGDSTCAFSFTHLIIYDNLVTSYRHLPKQHGSATFHSSCSYKLFAAIYLLLCGDIHPCPGPHSFQHDDPLTLHKYDVFHKRGLHFVHLNIRSLPNKIDELRILARYCRAACLCVTETWLDETIFDSEINIENYTLTRRDRNRNGGGVCIFVRNDFSFNCISEMSHSDVEAIWIELLIPKSKPILCGCLYRPPTQSNFYDLLENMCLSSPFFMDRECILLGDFNTDVSKNVCTTLNKYLQNFLHMFDLAQIIKDSTRVCHASKSTIDLILVSDKLKISQSGVIDIGISDHSLTYCTRKATKDVINKHRTVKLRCMKSYNKEIFQENLINTDWSVVMLCDNVVDAWNCFKNIFLSVIDNLAPVKEIRIKQRTEPWITLDILTSISERDKAFSVYKKNSSSANYEIFKNLRNKTQTLIYKAKQKYITTTIEDNKNDSKTLWKYLREIGMPSKRCNNTSSNIVLKISDDIVFDKLKIANHFNTYFTSIASDLVSKLPKALGHFGVSFVSSFYLKKGVTLDSCSFSLVTENTVLKYLNTLSITKATGLDGISAKFVKDGSHIIACPLAHIINLSLIQGVVPDDLKTASVLPLYKKGDKTDVGNYRPISILNTLSKVFERIVYDQIEKYLHDKNLLYNFQSGFRKSFSTDTCLLYLTDYIRFNLDKGNCVGMILLDLQKAFDTVDHQILLAKLEMCGLGSDIVRWIRSYLSDRKQCVNVSGVLSSSAKVTCGVPQGSILGPLLFILYINDMSGAVKNKLLLYADDSAILVSGKNKAEIERLLSEDLNVVNLWLIDNKLSLHLGKTESIMFGSQARLSKVSALDIYCNGCQIKQSSSVKYLGVLLDQSLSFESMVTSFIKKANARLKFLFRKKNLLSFYTKRVLINTLIQCHFDYACTVWYFGLSKNLKDRLQTTQNKLVRFALNLDQRFHLDTDHFVKLGWLPIELRVHQILLNHVFSIYKETAPKYLSNNFNLARSIHNHNTRFSSESCYALPKVKGFGKKSFSYNGCIIRNKLPTNIKLCTNKVKFKSGVKSHLLANMQ